MLRTYIVLIDDKDGERTCGSVSCQLALSALPGGLLASCTLLRRSLNRELDPTSMMPQIHFSSSHLLIGSLVVDGDGDDDDTPLSLK